MTNNDIDIVRAAMADTSAAWEVIASLSERAERAEQRNAFLEGRLREIVAVRLDVRVGDAAQAKARYTMRELARAALAAVSEEAA